jgi:hypothetical protein
VAAQPVPVAAGPAPEPARRDLGQEIIDMAMTEAGLIEPVLHGVVAPVTGEPLSTGLGLVFMALELIDLGRQNLSPQPPVPAQGRPAEQIWGSAGPAPGANSDRECCRVAAARHEACLVHSGPGGPGY